MRHLSAGRENQVQEFPLSHFHQLTIGREPSCEIKYDADRDDLVGRQHARLEVKGTEPPEVELVDLNSRNGTYVNKRRIQSPVRLSSGDVVQFGASSPEFQFNLDPPPNGTVRVTRFAEETSALPPTREAVPGTATFPFASSSGVGRQTMETMLAQSRRRTGLWIGAASLAVLLLIAGALVAIPQTRRLFFGQTGTGTKITLLTPKKLLEAIQIQSCSLRLVGS